MNAEKAAEHYDTPEARHLAELTAELRGITDQLKADFTPEKLAQLTPRQRAVLRSELTTLRLVSSRVMVEIGEHINAMQEGAGQ